MVYFFQQNETTGGESLAAADGANHLFTNKNFELLSFECHEYPFIKKAPRVLSGSAMKKKKRKKKSPYIYIYL